MKKDILDYEGHYQITTSGLIYSLKSKKYLKPQKCIYKNRNGYASLKVTLCKNGFCKTESISILMAETFLGHKRCGRDIVVDHIDFNPMNNNLDNLQLITNSENVKRSVVPKGYYFDKSRGQFKVQFKIDGKMRTFGRFELETDAISKANEIKNDKIYTDQWKNLK